MNLRIFNTFLFCLRSILSMALIATILLAMIHFATGIRLHRLTPDLSCGHLSCWGIKYLHVSMSYGHATLENLYWKQSQITIEHIRLQPHIPHIGTPLPIDIDDLSISIKPTVVLSATIHGYNFYAENKKENTYNEWQISTDNENYLLHIAKQQATITTLKSQQQILTAQLDKKGYQGQLDLSFITGFQGQINWLKNGDVTKINAQDIETPWCSLQQASLSDTQTTHQTLSIHNLKCSDIIDITNFSANHNQIFSEIHFESNIGNLHARSEHSPTKNDNTWHEIGPSQWHINSETICITHIQGHQLCLFPDKENYFRASGPFESSTRPWPGMLAHIGLEGRYNVTINSKLSENPFHITLSELKGDLDHLAKVFFMRIRYLFQDGNIHLEGSLDGLQGEGELRSTQGNVRIKALWESIEEGLKIDIISDLLRLTDRDNHLEGKVDLSLWIATLTRLTGNVDILNGKLYIKPMIDVETLHEDVQIAGMGNMPRFAMALDIQLLNKIAIRGMGLNGQVSGWIDILSNAKIEQSIQGELNVHPAQFRVFGREIIFDNIQINWSNQGWDKANIDILAHRKIASSLSRPLKVDLSINGPWDTPNVQLSSNLSSVNELQILSHLFARSVTSNPKEDQAIIEAVQNNPGQKSLLKLLQMVDGIERGLGLDLFEVGGMEESAHSSMPQNLTVGKLLHPKIMLKYKMSLDSSARNHITLDYNIFPHINIELDTDQQDAGVYLLYEH